MYHPTTRVLAVLELLQVHGRLTGPELARRLEVDGRTLRRYITMLQDLGIPIVAERGRHGAYTWGEGAKLPPLMFSNDEALALTLGLLSARQLGLAEGVAATESARAKLERVLPQAVRDRVHAFAETVVLEPNPAEAQVPTAIMLELSRAAHDRRRVTLVYQAADNALTERNLDPYGLAFRAGKWYVVGHCSLRRGPRTFRLDRIQRLDPLTERFSRPADFDVVAYLDETWAHLPRTHAFEVWLSADLATAQRELEPGLGVLEPDGAGTRLRGRTDHFDWFAGRLAQLPFTFKVRTPDGLRSALRTLADHLVAASLAEPAASPDHAQGR